MANTEIARMANGGYLIEYVTPPKLDIPKCPWKHPDTCKECPVKCEKGEENGNHN